MSADDIAGAVVGGLFLATFYFAPLIVAAAMRSTNLRGIALIDGLLGWTLVGWVVAWVMCFTSRPPARQETHQWSAVYYARNGLSPDGRFWWDGAAWRDTTTAAPPHAHRTPDGRWWWDGLNWRPVPQPPGVPSWGTPPPA